MSLMKNQHLFRSLGALLLAAAALTSTIVLADDVATIAGSGKSGYSGDGGQAQDALVGGPFGVAIGPDGALYVCEIDNHVIRRIDMKSGVISTVAGSGEKGYSGDGGPATKAKLNEPYEVRFDADGNMLFVEMQNHLVRRVDAETGIISTIAGTGTKGFSGDGGQATSAELSSPHSIALDDAAQLYICDIGNHRIRKVDLTCGLITTFSGTGEKLPTPDGAPVVGTPLSGPRALDFDPKSRSLWLALREGNAVYRIDLETQTLHHIAGTGEKGFSGDGGKARLATFNGPKGIAVGPNGSIFVADTENNVIREICLSMRIIETAAGHGERGDGPDGSARACKLDRPHGVFVDADGKIYIGDSSNHRVRVCVPVK